ncbi:hypothetical protein [Komagataeibacter xylinus]|uniref:hypothetical protein n=1 Tax=Komagataeibacter xylinus TaxID=28448 RepID=UPI0013300BC4|nr:hypothetical protein [Komagataeibacter xylinus]
MTDTIHSVAIRQTYMLRYNITIPKGPRHEPSLPDPSTFDRTSSITTAAAAFMLIIEQLPDLPEKDLFSAQAAVSGLL